MRKGFIGKQQRSFGKLPKNKRPSEQRSTQKSLMSTIGEDLPYSDGRESSLLKRFKHKSLMSTTAYDLPYSDAEGRSFLKMVRTYRK